MTRQKKLYSTPTICKCKNGEWFVFFRFLDIETGKYKPFKFSEGLNRIKNPKEKEAEFKALRQAREILLESGWNPITKSYPLKNAHEEELAELSKMTFSKALDFAFKKKSVDWARKTKLDFTSVIKGVKQAASACHLINEPVALLKRAHYKILLDKVIELRKFSSKGYNKYRRFLSSLLSELVEWEVLEYNPIDKIKTKDEIKTVCHRPPTQDQRLVIVNRIKTEHRPYYRFISVLYGCTIRPKEITALKVKNLHQLEQVFRLIPDDEGSTKTKYEREVAIPDWVLDLLMEMNLHKYDPEWYIFSTRNKYGSFLPGPTRMHPNTPSNYWKKIVKDPVEKGGLGMDVNQYSLKKLSGDDMIRLQRREGVDKLLELPRQQMGHTDSKQTETYVTEHLEVMKELVKRKMPIL
ncbi:tyrosine-type recombinase/integrase [Parasegetibacter sp. NRK P23]|uniref:tyrosine-type recombinase/integrase n=1 Tax=Parasegetibacter sp. NRK P23 TaxID=2942999 RepID=UPI0020435616|nr:tyrosine-type recombinase/integrase [Parasegetibacter sp. NRK P23]MCM5528988.1 tyrosine-type recombinase/integrase [Parasegetibacter sp. NRK P23]